MIASVLCAYNANGAPRQVHHGFERMRLRGLSGARDEFHLAAIVQNLKSLTLRTLGRPLIRQLPSFA